MALETTTTTSMENGYGYGYGYGDNFCELEKSIGGVESRLIDKMGNYAFDNAKNHSDIAARQAQDAARNAADAAAQATQFERDLQNRVHETRMILTKEIGDSNKWLSSKVDGVSDKLDAQYADVKNQLRESQIDTLKGFSALEVSGLKNTSEILQTLAGNKYDALKDEVDAIRADRYADKHGYHFALQGQELNYLRNSINSIEQNQRFSSKTVQFGEGNTAGTAQTANQG